MAVKPNSVIVVNNYITNEKSNGKKYICRNDIFKNLNLESIEYAVKKLVAQGKLIKEKFNGRSIRYAIV
jgi:predicted transcriptional regulator